MTTLTSSMSSSAHDSSSPSPASDSATLEVEKVKCFHPIIDNVASCRLLPLLSSMMTPDPTPSSKHIGGTMRQLVGRWVEWVTHSDLARIGYFSRLPLVSADMCCTDRPILGARTMFFPGKVIQHHRCKMLARH